MKHTKLDSVCVVYRKRGSKYDNVASCKENLLHLLFPLFSNNFVYKKPTPCTLTGQQGVYSLKACLSSFSFACCFLSPSILNERLIAQVRKRILVITRRKRGKGRELCNMFVCANVCMHNILPRHFYYLLRLIKIWNGESTTVTKRKATRNTYRVIFYYCCVICGAGRRALLRINQIIGIQRCWDIQQVFT